MLLALDIGNTNIVLALFDGDQLNHSWRIHTNINRTTDDWWLAIKELDDHIAKPGAVDATIISSVVPLVGKRITDMCERYLNIHPVIVNSQLPLDLGLNVDDPSSVGADRICNVVAGRELCGTPCVVVDLGTATTFDIVDEDGHFVGGSIMPGIETSAQRLMLKAALLADVELKVPDTVFGKDTKTNLQAGIVFGAVDQIDGMIDRIKTEGNWSKLTVAITGGLAKLISGELRNEVIFDPELTVKGLQLIYRHISNK